jgi:type III pantothenate kinase
VATVVLLDIGNTKTKLAISDGRNILQTKEFFSHEPDFSELPEQFDHWVLSSVVPELGSDWIAKLSKVAKGIQLKKAEKFDFIFDVSKKAEVGDDRLADIEGAYFLGFNAPFITIDFGTASVINLVTPKNEFVGGAIGPGDMSSFDCLISKAALLKSVELEIPSEVIGHDTKTNLDAGFIFGFSFWAEGFYHEIKKFYPELKALMTVGAASLISKVATFPCRYVPNLSLLGLLRILELNQHLL